jgi:hypothetical protein
MKLTRRQVEDILSAAEETARTSQDSEEVGAANLQRAICEDLIAETARANKAENNARDLEVYLNGTAAAMAICDLCDKELGDPPRNCIQLFRVDNKGYPHELAVVCSLRALVDEIQELFCKPDFAEDTRKCGEEQGDGKLDS